MIEKMHTAEISSATRTIELSAVLCNLTHNSPH